MSGPQRGGRDGADLDHEDVVAGIGRAEDRDAAERVRQRAGREGIRSPDEAEEILQDQEQAERDEELVLLRPAVERPQHRRLEDGARQGGCPRAHQEHEKEGGGRQPAREQPHAPGRDVGAERVEVAVRHVDDAHDPVDEGEPARDEK
jgi:hypothetical protein